MDPAVVREATALARLRAVDEAAVRGDSAVQAFYQDAVVFITGGSGFLGKQLIEKLFRSCDIKRMYLLVRQKKDQSPQERISKIFKDSVFDTLRKRKPGFEERVRAVQGDVTELKLGISDEERQILTNEVTVIFHVAATIAFDEPLRVAVRTNVRGTVQALQLGKECNLLRSFVHVSTAYSHATAGRIGGTVDEDFYDSPASPNTIIDLVEQLSEEKLAAIKPELIKDWPNTYAYTKALAEEAVRTLSGDLPICIVRPAIVISSSLEPSPGWVDLSSVFGPSGILLGIGLGVMHTFMANSDSCIDLIPVDLVINSTIVAGWAAPRNHLKIYTLTTTRNSITWRRVIDIMYTEATNYASPKAVWYSFHVHTKLHWLFLLLTWLLHYIPGYLADGVLKLLGKKPKVVKIYQLAFKLSTVLSFYTCHEFRFKDDNLRQLYDSLSTTDKTLYNFDIEKLDWVDQLVLWSIGMRRFIVKDGLEGTKKAIMWQRIGRYVNYLVLALYFYSLYCLFCFTLWSVRALLGFLI